MPVVAERNARRPLDHTCDEQAIPIVRGMPAPSLFEAAERVEVILGGCDPSGPTQQCRVCGRTWGGFHLGRY